MLSVLLPVIILIVVLLSLWKTLSPKDKSSAPGPKGIPILGNLLQMGLNPPEKLFEWGKKYGQIMAVHLGMRYMVVLNDPELARTVLGDDNTTGRDQSFFFANFFKGKGLLMAEGDLWKEQRRFALTTLRNLGMGKSWLEDAILAEVTGAISVFGKKAAEYFDPRPVMTLSVSNVICALVFGKRYDHSDARFLRLVQLIGLNARLTLRMFPMLSFPWLKNLPFSTFKKNWIYFEDNVHDIETFCKELIQEHKQALSQPEAQDDSKENFVKGYLAEQAKKEDHEATNFNDEQMKFSVINLFAAGTETVTSTLLWGFTFMVRYPEVQRKVQEEIDENIAQDAPVRISDRGLLKYTDATIHDIQRLASVVPLSIAHTNFSPMKIDGFPIPERTLINTNAYGIHRDQRFWKDPYNLCPEHFLDSAGNLFIPKAFLPFGVGKRACPGENLAKMELYLFFTNILKNFTIEGDPTNLPRPDGEPVGFIRPPSPYKIRFVPRT